MDYRIESSPDPKDREADTIEQGPQEIKNITADTITSEDLCRICLSNEVTPENPFLSVCNCKGTTRYSHFECLRKWLNYKMVEKKSNVLTTYQWKIFDCELCSSPYPFCVQLSGVKYKLFDIDRPSKGNYLILESLTKDKMSSRIIHVITPQDKKSIKLGRGHDSDVRVSDISVSRCHALISMRADGFYIEDNISKFGTLVMVKEKEQIDSPVYKAFQVGRTLVFVSITKDTDKDIKSPEVFPQSISMPKIEGDISNIEKPMESGDTSPKEQPQNSDINNRSSPNLE